MRPGQLTPENPDGELAALERSDGFNEAGAINPGKHLQLQIWWIPLPAASMRPGQLTPENPRGRRNRREGC